VDSYREHPSEFEPAAQSEAVRPDIGSDERRMHVRAYNYWASLLDGRDYPSIEDLEPGDLKEFAPHSVLLDFTAGRDNPATPYIGDAIRVECGLGDDIQTIAHVPNRSLLSRLTDHYMQIIANRAPVGFEAEFENQRGENICYRGILMPFSSDGDTIDFIYGVINWKKGEGAAQPVAAPETAEVAPETAVVDPEDEPGAYAALPIQGLADEEDAPLELGAELIVAPAVQDDEDEMDFEVGADAGIGDRLWAARETAEAAKASEGRSRTALYQALSRAWDFALAAKADPDGYAELLDESGVKAQVRAPMTAIVKLVFGIDYDKARLTEFAAALSYAEREGVELGGFLNFVERQAGGLKALVAAERQARRPEPKPDTKTMEAKARLREAAPMSLAAIGTDEEFALVLTRRSADGAHQAVAVVDDPALVERALRHAAG